MSKKLIQENIDHIITFRRNMHENPELSFEEFETTKNIADGLQDTAFEFFHLKEKTGLIGYIEKDKSLKTLAIRADIDALPIIENTGLEYSSQNEGVMHACGHDIHTSILYGYCKIVSDLKENLNYNVVVIFQPAEEIMEGAQYILKELKKLDIKIDEIIAYHTWPFLEEGKVGYRTGDMMAGAMSFDVEIKASGGHAAHPHTTADPVFLSSNVIGFIQTIVSRYNNPVNPLVITVGTINGGTKSNVISDSCKFSGTIRSFSKESLNIATRLIEEYINNITDMSDAQCDVTFSNYCPPVINNQETVNNFVNSSPAELMEELAQPSMGSEDFAFYLEEIDGALFRVGTKIEGEERSVLGLHNAKIIFSEKAISAGIEALLNYTTK
ncbi:M20 metallopeptidase family protein [Lacicoccus qingdaonensis]|uniref:Hippurate hydrolase/carboxypeptidase Ss1 n=1 Tax=Lacicoccus qingdaonensis TaxID=576118 RepID=A0A1G9G6A7_9BACL|nr:M20 family metallopeptidase [Salinicoccus qingdaonensis]SDK96240.1 hippurate hydrolase/carboxypeptidase Ss1 [Salinicoccus qingdaonensis]